MYCYDDQKVFLYKNNELMKNISSHTVSHLRDSIYSKIGMIRDVMFHRLVIHLTHMKITPDHLTVMGVVMMIFYLFLIPYSTMAAMVCLIMAVTLDSLDGVLARHQKKSSDRGKFFDVMADNFSSFLFSLGLALCHLVNPLIMIAYVYFKLLGKVFKIYMNSFHYQSDWLFRAVAGFSTNFINYLGYMLFIFSFFYHFELDFPFLIMTIVLIFYSGWHFIRIINMRPSCNTK
jgi:phosphatidylglycerophosphate synthase